MAVDPPPQPVVVKPVPQRRAPTVPRSRTATQAIGRQAPNRVSAAVPQAVAAVSNRFAALPQPRQATPAANLQAQAEQEEDAIESYLGLVYQKLESHRLYPSVTERRRLDGRVVLRFTVRRDGEVLNPEVVEVVGHSSFRKAALQALTRLGQLPQFPDEIRRPDLLVEVPITYRMEDR